MICLFSCALVLTSWSVGVLCATESITLPSADSNQTVSPPQVLLLPVHPLLSVCGFAVCLAHIGETVSDATSHPTSTGARHLLTHQGTTPPPHTHTQNTHNNACT